jgi:hypothetical protein
MFILSHMFEEIAANVGGIPGCPEFLPLRFPSTNWGKTADLADPVGYCSDYYWPMAVGHDRQNYRQAIFCRAIQESIAALGFRYEIRY